MPARKCDSGSGSAPAATRLRQWRVGTLSHRSIIDERRDFNEARRRDGLKWILKAMIRFTSPNLVVI
ncbi:hypothetical protein Syun_021555 [Stephania yunnanensis]|uniref:Uncharacterized protein n=1 Tax=Stephania yunnanensis TaxID=152371 RepID=A0AAP0NPU9_9MAGN